MLFLSYYILNFVMNKTRFLNYVSTLKTTTAITPNKKNLTLDRPYNDLVVALQFSNGVSCVWLIKLALH